MSAELFRRFAANADRFATGCAFRASLEIAARKAGIDPAAVVNTPRRANQLRAEPRTEVFREALYLTVVHFNRPQRSVSRVVGVSQPGVRQGINSVERGRDDQAYDRYLDDLELMLMGDAA